MGFAVPFLRIHAPADLVHPCTSLYPSYVNAEGCGVDVGCGAVG
jgi:hypothetical protein